MSAEHGFDLEDLRVFRAVVEVGSFTGAAAALHSTQSGVSRRIARLERAMGGPVLVRLARGVRTNPAGELLLGHAEEVLRRVDGLVEEVSAHHRGTGGRLRIGSFQTANAWLTPRTLATFRRDSPGVTTTVVEGLTPALLGRLADGALDLAVVSDYPTGTVDDDGVELRHLLDDPLLVALPAGHPAASPGPGPLRLADLADETWISAGPAERDTLLALAARRAGIAAHVDLRVASWTAKFGYVSAGLGLTLVPGLLAGSAPPHLVLKTLDDLPPRRVWAALPGDASPAARHFTDLLLDTVTGTTPA